MLNDYLMAFFSAAAAAVGAGTCPAFSSPALAASCGGGKIYENRTMHIN